MSDVAKGIRECLDTINKLREQNAAQAAEIATLQKRCEEAERTALQAAECHARETRRADALQKRVADLDELAYGLHIERSPRRARRER